MKQVFYHDPAYDCTSNPPGYISQHLMGTILSTVDSSSCWGESINLVLAAATPLSQRVDQDQPFVLICKESHLTFIDDLVEPLCND